VLAESECLADEEARKRRRLREQERRADQDEEFTAAFAAEICDLFPGCPTPRAEGIAFHAARRGSGRVGRSAADRNLEPGAVRMAVVASVRHLDTPYDGLLMSGMERGEARLMVSDQVDQVLGGWST
jgi:hypothetical protein